MQKELNIGLREFDPFSLLLVYSGFLVFDPVLIHWVGVLKIGGREIYREHKNVLRLADLLCEFIMEKERLQGAVLGRNIREDLIPLVENSVTDNLVVDLKWTRPRYPTVLKNRDDTRYGLIMDDAFSRHLDELEREEIANYQLSNNVEEADRQVEGLIQLAGASYESDVDDIVDGLIMMMATDNMGEVDHGAKCSDDYYDLMVANTASGAVNVDASFGASGGNKYKMQIAAAMAAEEGTPMLNYEVYPKSEVIKKNKKVRHIVCEPYPIYLKNFAFTGELVKKHGLVVDGDANGLSRMDGKFNSILMSMWLDHKVFSDCSYEDFVDLLEKEGLCEDDKKSWEATINRNSGWAFVYLMAANVNVHPSNREDWAQVLAHYAWPPIKYNGHKTYIAEWRVPSGNFMTLLGNTKRHMYGYQLLSARIQEHGYGLGDCECKLCNRRPRIDISIHDLSKIVGGVYMGDDRLRRRVDMPVGEWIDTLLGTKTVGGVKSLYEAEFLKVRFCKGGSTRRDRTRCFAKLRYGLAKEKYENFLCAMQSLSLELGDDIKGNQLLVDIYESVYQGEEVFNDDLQTREGLEVGEALRPFTYNEVQWMQYGFDKVILDVAHNWASSL